MEKSASADTTPHTIRLADYTPPTWQVERIQLRFELDPTATRVYSELQLRAHDPEPAPLRLDGDDLELESLALNGAPLGADAYQRDDQGITLTGLPARCRLEVVTRINPEANTALEGLYRSGGNYCTQCEAEGFRRITYFPDRPDVMSIFTTTVVAPKAGHPVLLANGNLRERGELADGRHYAVWHDPFPKPAYLFALVAGDLARIEDHYTTVSGREVLLEFYVQHGNEEKCGHAMAALKHAMAWDEQHYGREYDLDRYMVVAVDDFNMGAMENKGLNVFNARFVLARPETATDLDFANIEGVIAHEYFHNWSGNRVTCRDWFQLSLKEGFTVFRDSQFSADMGSAAVKRIQDVRLLRTHQFAEDAGPMAHPVRPESYVEINNFYTLTVYEKGAEVVRMLHTLLGAEGFRRGSDRYFSRHDGQAVTTDDFVAAMEDANGVDLTQFRRWYSQAGTPCVTAEGAYDPAQRRYTLSLRQETPPTPGQTDKQPLHIPVRMGLLGPEGEPLPLRLAGEASAAEPPCERVLSLTQAQQAFVFEGVEVAPLPSLLRGFSAPVRLEQALEDRERAFLMAHDSDLFNRWEAGQQLAVALLLARLQGEEVSEREAALGHAFGQMVLDEALNPALAGEALSLPEPAYLAEFQEVVDPSAIHRVREQLRQHLATGHRAALTARYRALQERAPYRPEAAQMGRRRLRNVCLGYLMALGDPAEAARAQAQYYDADNMTDRLAALTALVHHRSDGADEVLADFYGRWADDPLVVDKWFSVQATIPEEGTLKRVQALTEHPAFNLRNPNRVRAVLGAFAMRNPVGFHTPDGGGYRLLADYVLELDRANPQVAARLLQPLTHWRRYEPQRRELMQGQLERVAADGQLSRDVYEVASKGLA